MSIASVAVGIAERVGIVAKKKHPAIEQFETDVVFFKALRRSIEVERDPAKKDELLKAAVAGLKDGNRNVVAKMVLAGLGQTSDWDVIVDGRAKMMEDALRGDTNARDRGADLVTRAQTELPILINRLNGLAGKGKLIAQGQQVWSEYQKDLSRLQEVLERWKVVNALKKGDKKGEVRAQALRAEIWTRAMNEQLSAVIRLEMLEPRNVLVAQWKMLAQRLVKGEDVAQDLAGLRTPIERTLTAKLAEFAKATFGVAVAV